MESTRSKASWLELFYDVAFIALVAQLTYLAAGHHHTLTDFLNIGIIGYTIFIAWWATTANRNLQPQETAVDKLFVQLQMVGVFLMSISMAGVFDGVYMPFFLTLAIVRLLQVMMLVRMYRLYPESRPQTYNILQGLIIAGLLWAASGFAPDPYHFVWAFAALALDILIPLTRGKGNTTRYLNVHHLQERLGLFLMLVIGESMIVVALSNSVQSFSVEQFTIVFSGLGLMTALWWLYFEHSEEHVGTRPNNLFLFLHAHGFLFGSIILVSAGYKLLLDGAEEAIAILFVLVGAVGIAGTLVVIRATQHTVCVRAVVLLALCLVVAGAIVMLGTLLGFVYTAVVGVTTVFAVVAVADYFKVFRNTPTAIE